MADTRLPKEERFLSGVLRLNAGVSGLVLGILLGVVVFIATNWLSIKGSPMASKGTHVVGPHLQLLNQFFIGYKVSFTGSIIGFFYGFALGTLCGSAIGWIYNKIVDFLKTWPLLMLGLMSWSLGKCVGYLIAPLPPERGASSKMEKSTDGKE